MVRFVAALDALDRRLFDRLTRRDRRVVDLTLKRLSNSANRSVVWLAIAGLIAIVGGRRGRRAAIRGVVSIAITSTLVNLPLKYLARRDRPPPPRGDRPLPISLPGSFSFPSGHAASAFAFATRAGLEEPRTLVPVLPLAAAVAYSRVHLRVHYPFDVLAGAAIGTGMGLASGPVIRFARQWWDAIAPVPEDERARTNEAVLVFGPHAGREAHLARARTAMTGTGLRMVGEVSVEDLSRLPGLLNRNGSTPPLVVAAGGDGTVGAVANALIGTQAVLGVLPLGTSNDFARSLKIPIRVENAVRLLSHGRVSSIDAGRLTRESEPSRHFVHAAATGLNVQFAKFATRADLRQRLGRLNYAFAAAMALKERPVFTCDVEYEGKTDRLSLVHLAVINAPVFGGFLDLKVPGATPDDGALHVLMIEHLPMRRLLRSAFYPALGVHRRIRGFRIIQVSRLSVLPTDPMDVTLDGEIGGRIPGTFDVVRGGLRVITPASYEDDHR
ncbi:MAG TPA: YegS/Rv2252/BmrU family lipid kinase [Candidatus Dormibacteraeota bacterium]|nr:YegS/Rv2252/BmrU family lipid kinase [Candidatus Dormibacteraeota bacterium]